MFLKRGATRLLTAHGTRGLFSAWTREHVPILMMHRFGADGEHGERVASGFLEQCARLLTEESYRVLTLGELCRELGRGAWPERAVCLTVDDGYEDFVRIAAPILSGFGLPCTVFLTTGLMDGRGWNWWDRVDHAFKICGPRKNDPDFLAWLAARLRGLGSPAPERLTRAVVETCKEVPEDDKLDFLGELESALEVELPTQPPGEYRGMSWDDARRLAEQGFELGAHTVSHPILSRLDRRRAAAEIVDSIEAIETHAGVRPVTFCYPNGRACDFNADAMDLLRDQGVLGAVTAEEGVLDRAWLKRADRAFYRLPRLGLPDSMPRFVQYISGLEALKQDLRGAWSS